MNTPRSIEVEAQDLAESRLALTRAGYIVTSTKRTLAGFELTIMPCECDACRLARGEPINHQPNT